MMISLLLDIKDSLLGSVAVRLLRAKRGMRSLAKIIDSQTEEELLRNVAEFRKELEFRNTLKAVLERIEEIERKAASDEASLRDVWRFTHPLDAKWNYLNPLRANPSFQHWGVIVADVEKGILETVLSQRKWLKKMGRWCLGMIHELKRIGRDSAYQVRKWISNTIKKGFGITRVGQTALQNNEIAAKGSDIIEKNSEYRLGTADCQSFTISLLTSICCTTEDGKSVEEILGHEKLSFTSD